MRMASIDSAILRVPVRWRAMAAILVLCGAIGLVVESRARILRSGAEVRLKTAPVDPRDLFRGDYVVLSYDISTATGPTAASDGGFARGDTVHVSLVPDAEGFSRVSAVSRMRPAVAAPQIVMTGRVITTGACASDAQGNADCARGSNGVRIAYGIESYFVPQGAGRAIETTDRSRIEVVAAVSASGEAAIKRLLIDGKLVHAEPPY